MVFETNKTNPNLMFGNKINYCQKITIYTWDYENKINSNSISGEKMKFKLFFGVS